LLDDALPWPLHANRLRHEATDDGFIAMLTAQQVIERLRLEPLTIEGGYFRETYRSTLLLAADALRHEYGGPRSVSTAIYYLLTPETFSIMHCVNSDEVFHFYAGDPVEMLQLPSVGGGRIVPISNDLAAGHEPQVIVPAGVWQGCRLVRGGRWALLGCTVAPGFDYADYTAGKRAALVAEYPEFAEMIAALTLN
jgi:predicted cupin superfamily sugar epimerase